MLIIDAGQPQPSAAPTPSQPVPTPTPSHVQIPTPPITPTPLSTQPPPLTQPVQSTTPPPQPSRVQPTSSPPPIQPTSSPPPIQPTSSPPPIQPTSSPPPIQPVQPTSSPPITTILDTQPTHPPSPQILLAAVLHDTIAAQRKFLAEQRYAALRNKPPTISQLRNQMITYLKHVANKKHAELKSKSFEEIQVLYERYKKQDQTFVAIGSEEDERAIKKMNEQAADKEKEHKAESVNEETKEEKGAKKRKLGTRRKQKSNRRKYTSGLTREDDDLKICLHIAPDEDKVIDVEILDHQYPIVEWQSFFLTTKPQHDLTKPEEDIYLNKVTRSNGHQRFFRTLMGVLSILDREDLKAVYELVMEKYQDEIPEGFDKVLWGDLIIMFNQGDIADFWNEQLTWKIISWKLHSSSGVHTIMTSNGLVIHMLVENRYPLTKEVLSQLLDLKLETEEESTMALELIKFVKQQLEEFGDSDDDDLAKSDHEEGERV
ncbi:hypothetical protein Tco_0424710 [Tanacetum coccineum]